MDATAMRILHHSLIAALVCCLGVSGSGAEVGSPVNEIGLSIGERAPDFTLKDQSGQSKTLVDLRKKGITALLFYRSADW